MVALIQQATLITKLIYYSILYHLVYINTSNPISDSRLLYYMIDEMAGCANTSVVAIDILNKRRRAVQGKIVKWKATITRDLYIIITSDGPVLRTVGNG